MAELETGVVIAQRYRLDERLDAGGTAQVWAATDQELDRRVAVKILLTPEVGGPAFIEAFRNEAQVEAGLKHPGIVEIFDWGHDGDRNYIIMDLLPGHTVRQALDSQGPFEWPAVVGVGRQVAAALAYAHQAGVAHGHIAAERIVVAADGDATAIGFGLRCRAGCEVPESPDADTFALGGVLYEMLTGSSPFGPAPVDYPSDQPWPAPLKHAAPDAPNELDRIVMKAISPDPAQRYASAAELQADLDALAKPKSRAWLWWLLAILAVLVAAGATWFFSSQQRVIVPDVTRKTQIQAETILADAGFKLVVSGQAASSSVPTDTIISEDPAAGTAVRKGSDVAVIISTGLPTVAMPAVSGTTLNEASSAIASAGLVVGKVTRQNSDAFPVDTVISASQPAGTPLIEGTSVDLVVSAGQKTTQVPDVRGASQSSATSKLTGLGLKVDVASAYSSQPSGIVVSQGPAPGSVVPAGATVSISVSKGPAPVKMPNVINATRADAVDTITNLGLVPITSEESGTASQRGRVIRQDPEGGVTLGAHSRVSITIGK
jgi:eukaryotic-like serine/threonine-protein kinase